MAEDPDPADVFAFLDDEYAREILKATSKTPMPARQLADELDASRSTIYRRINQLRELDLLSELTEVDSGGHHRSVYQADLTRIIVDLEDDGFSIKIDRRTHPADQFTDIWESL